MTRGWIRWLVCAFVLLFAARSEAAITKVESVQGNSTNSASANASITVASGNGIVVAIAWEFQASRTISSVSDGGTNTYAQAGTLFTDANFGGVHYYLVCSAASSASLTITVTLDNTVDALSVQVTEINGNASSSCYDKQSTGTGASGANSQSVTSFTPTQNNSIVFATHIGPGFNQSITGQAGTLDQTQFVASGFSGTFSTQYLIQTTAAATTMSLTSSNGGGTSWGAKAIVIKEAGGGGGGSSFHRQMLLGCCEEVHR